MTYYDFKHSRCTDIFSLGRDANPIYPINVTRIFHPDILRYCDKRFLIRTLRYNIYLLLGRRGTFSSRFFLSDSFQYEKIYRLCFSVLFETKPIYLFRLKTVRKKANDF